MQGLKVEWWLLGVGGREGWRVVQCVWSFQLQSPIDRWWLQLHNSMNVLNTLNVYLFFYLKLLFTYFRQTGREGERKGEKH